jgi:hypothetical protein
VLLRNEEWIALETWNGQLVFLEDLAQIEGSMAFHIASVADLFELTRPRVHNIRVKAANKSRAPHRPLALSNEQRSGLCLMICERAPVGNSATKMELLNVLEEHFGVSLTANSVRCFLQRRAPLVQRRSSHLVNCRDCKFRASV